MSLDPDLAAFLELVEANVMSGSKPSMHELTPAQARIEYDASTQILDVPGMAVESVTLYQYSMPRWSADPCTVL